MIAAMSSRTRRQRARAAALQPASVVALADAAVERADAERERQRQARAPKQRKSTPLQSLYLDGKISGRQADAGRWLAVQYHVAHRTPTYTARLEAASRSVEGDVIPERIIAAERAIMASMRAAGMQGSAVLVHVVVLEDTLGSWARAKRWRELDALFVLRDALDAVAGVRG